ncbi:hypothetical protein Dimus_015738 [Dionaea muscipula]
MLFVMKEKAKLKEVFAKKLKKEDFPKYFDLINAKTLKVLKLAEAPHPRGMDLAGILKVVSERGGGHINKSFAPLMEEGATSTSDVPVKKVLRKKKTLAFDVGTSETEGATTGVANVSKKDVPSEGTVGATEESEAVVAKGSSKLKPKRLKNKDLISPAVGENLMEIEEVMKEEAEEEETLQVRSRRVSKAMSILEAKNVDSEETQSDEVISKEGRTKRRRQK